MTIDKLAYLHDAIVGQISLTTDETGSRTLRIVHVHADCGYEPWNGRKVTIAFSNVWVALSRMLGHTSGVDTIDSIRDGVAQDVADTFRDSGFAVPSTHLTVTFHSGSDMQIVCGDVDLEIGWP